MVTTNTDTLNVVQPVLNPIIVHAQDICNEVHKELLHHMSANELVTTIYEYILFPSHTSSRIVLFMNACMAKDLKQFVFLYHVYTCVLKHKLIDKALLPPTNSVKRVQLLPPNMSIPISEPNENQSPLTVNKTPIDDKSPLAIKSITTLKSKTTENQSPLAVKSNTTPKSKTTENQSPLASDDKSPQTDRYKKIPGKSHNASTRIKSNADSTDHAYDARQYNTALIKLYNSMLPCSNVYEYCIINEDYVLMEYAAQIDTNFAEFANNATLQDLDHCSFEALKRLWANHKKHPLGLVRDMVIRDDPQLLDLPGALKLLFSGCEIDKDDCHLSFQEERITIKLMYMYTSDPTILSDHEAKSFKDGLTRVLNKYMIVDQRSIVSPCCHHITLYAYLCEFLNRPFKRIYQCENFFQTIEHEKGCQSMTFNDAQICNPCLLVQQSESKPLRSTCTYVFYPSMTICNATCTASSQPICKFHPKQMYCQRKRRITLANGIRETRICGKLCLSTCDRCQRCVDFLHRKKTDYYNECDAKTTMIFYTGIGANPDGRHTMTEFINVMKANCGKFNDPVNNPDQMTFADWMHFSGAHIAIPQPKPPNQTTIIKQND